MQVQVGQAWYLVDRVEGGEWILREGIVTRVVGDQAILAHNGVSLQLDVEMLDKCYALTREGAWRRAEQRLVQRMDELRAARAAWVKG
jgi:hypothetical protein